MQLATAGLLLVPIRARSNVADEKWDFAHLAVRSYRGLDSPRIFSFFVNPKGGREL